MRHVRVVSVSAIAITLSALAAPVTAATTAGQPVTVTAAAPATGTQLWASRSGAIAGAAAIAVAPGGYRVFVTGTSYQEHYGREPSDYVTVAFSTATGARLWRASYNGPGTGSGDTAKAIAVSPNGSRVYVTGSTWTARGSQLATVAYNAATGARLWVARYAGRGIDTWSPTPLAVSPNGRTVFVTGTARGYGTREDYVTVAYNAATGRRLWVARYNGPANRLDTPAAMTVDPGGRRVYVTGTSVGVTSKQDYATVAYNAATGGRVWVKRYNGKGIDQASSLVVGPGGRRLFVTGTSDRSGSNYVNMAYNDYLTIAYNAATGASIWAKRYNGPENGGDEARSIAASPTGSRVFVTGTVANSDYMQFHYGTVAYDAATGAQAWVSASGTAGRASSIAVNPTADKVYVMGSPATVAHSMSTGAQLWAQRNPVAGEEHTQPAAIVVSRDGSRLFVAGTYGDNMDESWEILTVAYSG